MYRLASLLALLIAFVAAGCGGSDDDSDSPPSAVAQTRESTPSDDSGSDSADSGKKEKKEGAAEKSSESKDEAEEDDEPDTLQERQEAAFKRLQPKQQFALVETIARSALLRFGLTLVDVELRPSGRGATLIVARKGACNFVASQEPNLVLTIKEGAPGLRSVRFEVARTEQELGYYVVGCKKPEIPSGAGRVVLDRSGVGGPYTSKQFTIEAKHWALEWVNEAASLAVLVEGVGGESKGEYFKPVGSQKRESGRYDYTGRGTFQIKAYGAGGWRIRVKEMG